MRDRVVRQIPRKDYQEWSGRAKAVLNGQADRWGLPVRGDRVSIPEIVRWLHDFLGEHGRAIGRAVHAAEQRQGRPVPGPPEDTEPNPDDMPLYAGSSPALERQRAARASIAELELAQRRRELVPVADLRPALSQISSRLREAGDQLRRQFGPEALDVLIEAVDDCDRVIAETMDEDGDGRDDG